LLLLLLLLNEIMLSWPFLDGFLKFLGLKWSESCQEPNHVVVVVVVIVRKAAKMLSLEVTLPDGLFSQSPVFRQYNIIALPLDI
jgi:hypothetical protein